MTFLRPTRLLLLAGLCLLLAGAPVCASAQRGGGPPGGGGAPGGGGPPGGGMGGGNVGGPGGGGPGFGGNGGRMEPGGNNGGYRNGGSPNAAPMRPAEPMLAPSGGGRFWDERRTAKSLNLRSEQQHRMDAIFDANRAQLVTLYENLQREEARLSSMSQQDLQDQTKVFAAIDRVAQARAQLGKERAFILIQIRQQLDSQQLEKLDHQIAASH